MAIRYAVATGNWGTGSTWNGGTLPTASDDVYANGFTVTIDQDITVLSINTTAASPAVAGGGFTSAGNNRNITANITAGSSTCLTATQTGLLTIIGNIQAGSSGTPFGINFTGIGTITLNGNVNGGSSTSSYGIAVTNGTLNITGNITGGASSSSFGIHGSGASKITIVGNIIGGSGINGVYILSTSNEALTLSGNCISGAATALNNNSSGTVIINSNLTAAGNANVYAITNSSAGIININADILGALNTSPSLAYVVNNNSTGIVNISGSVIQRSIGPSSSVGIVNNASTGTINISGNVVGGSVANSIGVSNASTGTINVVGNISGGTNATMTPAIYSTTAGFINVSGETASGLYPALYSTSTTATNRLRGNIKSFNGVLPFVAWKINCDPLSAQTITIQDINNTDRIFGTSNVSNGAPLPSNVRSGIVYGSINEFTGTTIIATPDNVRKGVLTDNTVGTGQLTAEDFLNAISTGTDPLSIRLQNVSTVQSTGDQISNY